MPIYDLYCEQCKNIVESWLKMDSEPRPCPCGGKRVKMPGGHFKLKYNPKSDSVTWGSEGYSQSQYWKDVKEARSQGKKVKGANE
jgi:putative FmdB family regulatory protein